MGATAGRRTIAGEAGKAQTAGLSAWNGQAAFQRPRPRWLRRHLQLLVISDAASATVATLLAKIWAFGWDGPATVQIRALEIPYMATVLLAVPAWLLILGTSRGYDLGPFGTIKDETRRIVRAGAHFLAGTAIAYYLVNLERLAREFLIAIVPLAVILTLLGRWAARRRLHHMRQHGRAVRRAMFVGPPRSTEALTERLTRRPDAGLVQASFAGAAPDVPRAETLDGALRLLPTTDADIVLVTGAIAPGELRPLTWKLERTGVDVLVVPAATQRAGPRFDVRPVAGLPLLYVDSIPEWQETALR